VTTAVPQWLCDALTKHGSTAIDFDAIRDEWIAECERIVERAIVSQGTAQYAARMRAQPLLRGAVVDRNRAEVWLCWAAARAADSRCEVNWTPAVVEAQRQQSDALVAIVRQALQHPYAKDTP
jgi:hypothetical protein